MSVRDDVSTWEPSTIFMATVIALVALGSAFITLGAHLWALVRGVGDLSWNPFTLAFDLFGGELDPSGEVWWWIGGVAAVLLLIVLVIVVLVVKKPKKSRRGDEAAQHAGRGRDIEPITERSVAAKAERLGVEGAIGFPVGRTVAGNKAVLSSFEDVCITIAGPRTGKTTSWVVPRIFAAPGAVVATSNKRDIVDETRAQREAVTGEKAWVFDPQNLANTTQEWWWNPLSYVKDIKTADALANTFLSAEDVSNRSGEDTTWDVWAVQLISAMLFAATKSDLPITVLIRWLADQTEDEPVLILRSLATETEDKYAKKELENVSISLQQFLDMHAEGRSSVYAGANRIMRFLMDSGLMRWVEPVKDLPEFKPEEFVKSKGTLYCLSQEGVGSATQIVTPLTVAVVEAAMEYATTQDGGRLKTPMLIELDEAANVCRWSQLPSQYSHFGSRGLCVDTILQSWSQGERVWGEEGMSALWSAANLKVYGGGVSEPKFLRDLSELIGVHYVDSTQISNSSQGRSYSTSKGSQQRPIATVADLQALPQGRAWVFASGAVATLIRLIPFWEQPQLSEVQN